MKELIILSGKGGTGKTSLTAAFAQLAKQAVIADCDVDAADLHLILSPSTTSQSDFYSGHEAVIDEDLCCNCGVCVDSCKFDAIMEPSLNSLHTSQHATYWIDETACEGCGVCVATCPMDVIDFPERLCGVWMESTTQFGPMVHARLGIAAENSGKLVTTVRQQAKRIANDGNFPLILVDGPPGIGCPVIASVTGATHVLVVTEPTVSGEHDMERVLSLTAHFGIKTFVCVNKWDINPEMCLRIESKASKAGATVVGRIRYDTSVSEAQTLKSNVIDHQSPCAEDIRAIWSSLHLQ